MNQRILECVPNFSEGRDMTVIARITDCIVAVDGVKLLNVDPGRDTNRTVVTFVGEPEAVVEAAFEAAKAASELIDMRKHHGAHPRFGATDVLPLIPVSGVTMEEAAELARALAKRLGEELGISVYCYEHAALGEQRRNLAAVRAGEYEGLAEKLARPEWKPDFGPDTLNERAGATAVGARDFLVAYNANLNTTSTRRANAIAYDVREKGRPKREGGKLTGKILVDEHGRPLWEPGTLEAVKAIGWFIEEYGIAQISMNLTDIERTPVHVAFEEVCEKAAARGIRVTGSELVGLIPLRAMLEAGRYFLRKQRRSLGVPERELLKIAVKSLGLDDLRPFDPQEKIIEYAMRRGEPRRSLVDLTARGFVEETASESVAPGGGSVSALLGALAAALGAMVANLSAHKRGWDERWEEFSDWAVKGFRCQEELLALVDADTEAFNGIMAARVLPKETEEERRTRAAAIESATKRAIEAPLAVMRASLEAMEVVKAMAEQGNPSSASDAGVGALAGRSAVLGAFLNVRTNCSGLADRAFVEKALAEGGALAANAEDLEAQVLEVVSKRMG
jgi:glutamate formiminotransferase/formiminotetrahydrofolate cyclodeaminase